MKAGHRLLAVGIAAGASLAAAACGPGGSSGPPVPVNKGNGSSGPEVIMGTEAIVNVTYENRCDPEEQAAATGVQFTLNGFPGDSSQYKLEKVQPNLWTAADVQVATTQDTIATSGASQWSIEWRQSPTYQTAVAYGTDHHFGYALNNGTVQSYPQHHVTLEWKFGPDHVPLAGCVNDAWSYEWTPPVGSTPTAVVGDVSGTPSSNVVTDGQGWTVTAAIAQHSRDGAVADLAYYVSGDRLTVHDLMEDSPVFLRRTIARRGVRMPAGSVEQFDIPIPEGSPSVVMIAEFRVPESGEEGPYMVAFAGAPLDWSPGPTPPVPTN